MEQYIVAELLKTTGKIFLSRMLVTLQDSASLLDVNADLHVAPSNYCLIINIANSQRVLNLEYSRSLATRTYFPDPGALVSTNFFVTPTWGDLNPLDRDTWSGVTRRANILYLIEQENGNMTCSSLSNLWIGS